MIDWDAPDPKPNFTPPQNIVEIRTTGDALKLLDEWEAAYKELQRDYLRLGIAHMHMTLDAKSAQTLADGYQALYRAALDPKNAELLADLRAVELQDVVDIATGVTLA